MDQEKEQPPHRQQEGEDGPDPPAAATTRASPPPATPAPVRAGPPSEGGRDVDGAAQSPARAGHHPHPDRRAAEDDEGNEEAIRRPRPGPGSSPQSYTSSLLPLHPTVVARSIPSGTVTAGLRPYFASSVNRAAADDADGVVDDPVVRFWADAHVLGCCLGPAQPSLSRRASEVRADFRTADDGCQSMCAVGALRAASVAVDGGQGEGVLDELTAGAVARGRRLIAVDTAAAWENAAILAGRMLLLGLDGGAALPGASAGTGGWRVLGAAGALYSGATYVAGGTVRGLTALLSTLDLGGDGDDDEYGRDELEEARRWDAEGLSAVAGEADAGEGGGGSDETNDRGGVGVGDVGGGDVILVSVDLVSACCRALTSHVPVYAEDHASALDDAVVHDHQDESGAVRVTLCRGGTGPGSFRAFCGEAAAHLRATAPETSSCPSSSIEAVVGAALPDLLSQLTDDDLNFLATALLSSRRARSSDDGTLIALYSAALPPSKGPQQQHLSEAEVAAFRLVEARDANLARMDRLRLLSDRAGEDAVAAKRKRGTSQKVVLNHMRRRKRFADEADRCGDAVLTLESTLAALGRAAHDRNVVGSMEVARDALRLVRSEHGGEDPVEAVDDVAFELDEQSRLGEAVGSALLAAGGGGDAGAAAVDEDELERELEELVAHSPTKGGGHVGGAGDGGGGASAAATSEGVGMDDGPDLVSMPVAPSGSGGDTSAEERVQRDVST